MTTIAAPQNCPVVPDIERGAAAARSGGVIPAEEPGPFPPPAARPPGRPRRRRFALGGWALLIALCIAAALRVGWLVPPGKAVFGDSYVLGFNNFASTAAIGAGLVLTLGWLLITFRGNYPGAPLADGLSRLFTFSRPGKANAAGSAVEEGPWGRRVRPAYLAGVAVVLGVVGMWHLAVQLPHFGESVYFMPRIELMLEGLRPYRDFEFGYGPLLLLPVHWVYQLYGGSLAIEDAYALVLLLQFALGFGALWYVVACLRVSPGAKLAILLGQCLFWCNLSLGLQYTPLRFVFPLFALCHLWANRATPTARPEKFWLLALVWPLVGFGISPETGIVTYLSLAVLHGWQLATHRKAIAAVPLAITLGSMPLIGAVFGGGYFHTVFAFGGGGCGFPILPLPYILCFLTAAFLLIPALALRGLTRAGTEDAAFYAALAVSLGLALPAALGRCDPGHIGANGLPVVLLAAAVGSFARFRWQRALSWLGFAVILLTSQISFWSLYWDPVVTELRNQAMAALILPHRTAPRLFETHLFDAETRIVAQAFEGHARMESQLPEETRSRYVWSKLGLWNEGMLPLLRHARIGAPLNCDVDTERFLKASGRYVAGYHVGPADNVFSAADIERKIRDLDAMPTVLIPRRPPASAAAPVSGEEALRRYREAFVHRCRWMNQVLVSPWMLAPERLPLDISGPILREILARYERVAEVGSYDLMVRRANLSDAAH